MAVRRSFIRDSQDQQSTHIEILVQRSSSCCHYIKRQHVEIETYRNTRPCPTALHFGGCKIRDVLYKQLWWQTFKMCASELVKECNRSSGIASTAELMIPCQMWMPHFCRAWASLSQLVPPTRAGVLSSGCEVSVKSVKWQSGTDWSKPAESSYGNAAAVWDIALLWRPLPV